MPIYEYLCKDLNRSCLYCRMPFEVIQGLREPPLDHCPACGNAVSRIMSRCRAVIVEYSEAYQAATEKIREHERSGRFSHAAETADKMAEKTGDTSLRHRALENYAKAGYDSALHEKHGRND